MERKINYWREIKKDNKIRWRTKNIKIRKRADGKLGKVGIVYFATKDHLKRQSKHWIDLKKCVAG